MHRPSLLSCFAALVVVGCGADQHGLESFNGEQHEAGEALVEYMEAFERGDEDMFCGRVYTQEAGQPQMPVRGDDCHEQTLEAQDPGRSSSSSEST